MLDNSAKPDIIKIDPRVLPEGIPEPKLSPLHNENKEVQIDLENPPNFHKKLDSDNQKHSTEEWSKHSEATTLVFKDLCYTVQVPNKGKAGPKFTDRPILRNVSGICKPGELTAIMGSSGAGKTSLLNILSCRVSPNGKKVQLAGDYLANGNAYNAGKFSKFAGYVMQNDILLETLTPREVFMFTAELRIKGTTEEKVKRVNELLADLKLEKAADTFIGGQLLKGISGGERKRTSIGVELMTDPKLLFLDEPTSGLDSFTAFILLTLLKSLANKGKTIIFTIHQPSSDIFFLFDRLMILAKGKFIYQGSTSDAVMYFNGVGYHCPEYSNPADYFIEVAHAGDTEDDSKFTKLFSNYDNTLAFQVQSDINASENKPISLIEKQNTFWYTTKMIAKRSKLHFLRNPVYLRARIGQTIIFSFLICSLFFQLSEDPSNPVNQQNINGTLFFILMTQFMASAMSVVLTFPAERAVFLKEYSSNMYSVSSYFFGRQSTELPVVIFFPLIMAAIMYYIIGLNDYSAGKFFTFALVLITQALAGNAMGLLAGSAFSDVKVATGIVPLIMMPMMIIGGFFINSDKLPKWIGWLQYISPFRYGMEAIMWNQYEDSTFGTDVMGQYHFEIGLWGSWALLFGLGLVFRFMALFALKKLVKKLE